MTLEINFSSPTQEAPSNDNSSAHTGNATAPTESILLSISPPPTLRFHTITSTITEEINTEKQITKEEQENEEPLLLTPTTSSLYVGTGQQPQQKQDPTTLFTTSSASSSLLGNDKHPARAKTYGTSLTDDSFSALLSKGLPPAPSDAASTKFTQWQTMYQQFAYYVLCKKWQITLTASLLLFVASLLILVTHLELKLPRACYALSILTSMSGFILGSGMFICNTVLKYDTTTSSFSLKHKTLFSVLVSCFLLILVTYLLSILNTAVLPVSVKPGEPLSRVFTIPWILCFAPLLLALFVFIFMNVESFCTRYKQATRDNNFRSKNASLMKWNGFLCFALLCITSFVLMLSIHWETPYYKPTLFLMLSFSPLYLLEFASIAFYLVTTVLNVGKYISDKRNNESATESTGFFFMAANPQSSVERRMLLLLIILSPSMITAQLVITLYGFLSHWVLLSLALPLIALYSVIWLIMYEKEDKLPQMSTIAHIIHADFAEADTTVAAK